MTEWTNLTEISGIGHGQIQIGFWGVAIEYQVDLGLIGGMYNLIRGALAATKDFGKDSSKKEDLQKKEGDEKDPSSSS